MADCLQALVARHGTRKEAAALQAMDAAAAIIFETDLVLTGLALRFCTTLLKQQRNLGPHVTQRILPQALTLIQSPMLQVLQSCTGDECMAWMCTFRCALKARSQLLQSLVLGQN